MGFATLLPKLHPELEQDELEGVGRKCTGGRSSMYMAPPTRNLLWSV